jgi:hypothetical protein
MTEAFSQKKTPIYIRFLISNFVYVERVAYFLCYSAVGYGL